MLAQLLQPEKRFDLKNPPGWFVDWVYGGGESSSGVRVTASTALKYTPFWAAVRVISGTIASLPFVVYRRLASGGKAKAPEHRAYSLLHDRPNEYMDALTFIETRQVHLLTYGNAFAEIQRDGGGRPVALWPLLPNVTRRKKAKDGTLYYETRLPTGQVVDLPDYNVLHIKGLGFDGYTGYDVISYHKEAIGYGIGVKEYAARFFAGDGNPGGVLEHPGALGEDAEKHLKASFKEQYGGLKKSHRLLILEEGMKWSPTGVEPAKAQAIETQKFTVDDCSRIFTIPPHKLGSLDRATFSNIEEQNLDFHTSTMLYWYKKWEQECNFKLFMPSERKTYFCELLAEGMLRGNTEARNKAYATGRQWGWLSVNDILEKENMNPIGPAGDIYLVPINMQPADQRYVSEGDVRKAFMSALIVQLDRVVHKCIKASEQKNLKPDFWPTTKEWCIKIVSAIAAGYSQINGKTEREISSLVADVLSEEWNPVPKFTSSDSVRLARRIMEQIGDDNHNEVEFS